MTVTIPRRVVSLGKIAGYLVAYLFGLPLFLSIALDWGVFSLHLSYWQVFSTVLGVYACLLAIGLVFDLVDTYKEQPAA